MMNKKIFIILFYFYYILNAFTVNNTGISRLYSKFKNIDPAYHLKIEDILLASLSIIPGDNKYALNLNQSFDNMNTFFESWKKNDDLSGDRGAFVLSHSDIINELKNINTLICCEVKSLSMKEEKDFYDTNVIYYKISLVLSLAVFDIDKKVLMDENEMEITQSSKTDFDESKRNSVFFITKKIESYFIDVANLKQKIQPLTIGKLFITLNRGRDIGLRPGNILVYMQSGELTNVEHTVVQVVKVDDDSSLANILYTRGNIPENADFVKISRINLELQFGGGFIISQPKDQVPFLYPDADLRLIIPVGIIYFNPIVQMDFNFFYMNNKLLLPFMVETGIQGKFNIHRFEFAGGFLVGVLFSPDQSNTYQIDSASIRPYIHLDGIINSSFNIYGEFGYRYFVEDNFSKNWKTDLKGMYFSFGFGVCF
jgi:hypothetical protein